ncbi:MAG: hypothetical protein FJ098_15150 [Deltaproteobacteria bacterium]|nr:hypothetical protein [Deltaproteobacteria bacterium]
MRLLVAREAHNDRARFQAHRGEFEQALRAPSMACAEAMGERVRELHAWLKTQLRSGTP